MDDPESIRQRGLDAADETLHMLRQRQEEQEHRLRAPQGSAGEPEWTPPVSEPPAPVHPTPAPRERPVQQQSPHTREAWSDNWNQWAIKIVDERVGAAVQRWVEAQLVGLASGIGEGVAESQKGERELLRREFATALDAAKAELRAETAAAVAAVRIADLERRLAATERAAPKAPARPQLVAGGSDGAD